jgi:putative ABC transport system substrate-binding protein
MRRREFIAGLAAAAGLSFKAGAQQAPLRAGFMPVGSPTNRYTQSLIESFRQGLRDVGVVEGRDIVLDTVWLNEEPEIPHALGELMQRNPGLLIPCGTRASIAAKAQTSTIPILFISVGNPVAVGLVESFAHPGGNATGFTYTHPDFSGRYVQFAVELEKRQAPVNYLWFTGSPEGEYSLQTAERAAQALRVDLRSKGIRDISEADGALAAMKGGGATTVIVQSSPFTFRYREPIIEAAMKHGMATIYDLPPAARDGALIAYGADYGVMYHRAAAYVKRILQGTKPSELPVEQPSKFELAINLKTAKALGISVPLTLINAADEVIQ